MSFTRPRVGLRCNLHLALVVLVRMAGNGALHHILEPAVEVLPERHLVGFEAQWHAGVTLVLHGRQPLVGLGLCPLGGAQTLRTLGGVHGQLAVVAAILTPRDGALAVRASSTLLLARHLRTPPLPLPQAPRRNPSRRRLAPLQSGSVGRDDQNWCQQRRRASPGGKRRRSFPPAIVLLPRLAS